MHPPTLVSGKTSLAADYVAGVSSIEVKNTASFLVNKYALLGPLGYDQSELDPISTVTAPTTLALGSNTKFPHNADDLVILFDFNQIKIYRSITGIAGTYVYQSTLDIDVSDDFTVYEDLTAQSTYYYKFTYYNSQTLTETDLSDPIAATGFVFYSLKTMADRTLSLFGDAKAEFVSRNEVGDYLNEFYEEAQQEYAIVTKRLNLSTQLITLGSTGVYPLSTDFLMEKGIPISEDGGVHYRKYAVSQQVDSIGNVVQSDAIKYGYRIISSNIEFVPIPNTTGDIAKVYYVPVPSTLILQTDTLVSPFQNRSSMFVKYALGMCYLKDKNETRFKDLVQEARNSLDKFLKFTKKMQNLHPQFVELVDQTAL